MKIVNHKVFKTDCIELLTPFVTRDYAKCIYTAISGDLIDDVESASDNDHYNSDDIRFAIGRVLCNRLGIEF